MTIQKATVADADLLLTYSKKTFYDFFGHLNSAENMEAYASGAFTMEKTLAQLNNPESEFYFALVDGDVAGYLKLNYGDAQNELQDKNALEIERIYVSAEYHDKYIGKQLLEFAINEAKSKKLQYIWLGVWEHNDKALAFYKRNGFEVFDSHPFWLGDDEQVDLMMKRELTGI